MLYVVVVCILHGLHAFSGGLNIPSPQSVRLIEQLCERSGGVTVDHYQGPNYDAIVNCLAV